MKKALIAITAVALFVVASPAFAQTKQNHGNIVVSNSNFAATVNVVHTNANTGHNQVNNHVWRHNRGTSGFVVTGNAHAATWITNDVNYNKTVVNDGCGCNAGDVTVRNRNGAFTFNAVQTGANTGYNTVGGSDLGSILSVQPPEKPQKSRVWSGYTSRFVVTGVANSQTGITNIVNSNVTRVNRGY